MSAAARLEIASDRFDTAVQRLVATSKKSAEQVLRDQAKLLVVEVAKITPPNKDFKWNRQGGETTNRNDLAKLFRKSSSRIAETDLKGVHRRARNRFGRIGSGVQAIPAKGLPAYTTQVLAKVGLMAAGWKAAATKLGAKLPAWITRHNSSGFATVRTDGSRVDVTIGNATVYPRLANALERRAQAALSKRSRAINRRVDYFLKQNARRAGFR
jgi:hypothetical protein